MATNLMIAKRTKKWASLVEQRSEVLDQRSELLDQRSETLDRRAALVDANVKAMNQSFIGIASGQIAKQDSN